MHFFLKRFALCAMRYACSDIRGRPKKICPSGTVFEVLLEPIHPFFNIFHGIGVGKA